MDYREALDHLDSLINHEVSPRAGRIEGLSLAPMRSVMATLGDPHLSYPVIHVTGTNGKGSTVRMIESMASAMGLRVGTYTSPHLESINERIGVVGQSISDDDLAGAVTEVVSAAGLLEGTGLTWFETMTAAGLVHFANEAVDLAVLEVGMLGRFDATNVAHGQIAVVTNVGLDHTDGTGDWRRAIASEKAGIIEPDATLVLGEVDPSVAVVFKDEKPAKILERGIDFDVIDDDVAVGGRMVDFRTPHGQHNRVFLGLHGRHQVDNAALAITAVESFFDSALPEDVVTEALESVTAPGRMEIVSRSPLVVLDVAHNPPGAEALAAAVDDAFGESGRIVVLGLLDGRDPRAICEALGVADAELVIACAAPSRRGLPADQVAEAALLAGANVEVVPGVTDAIGRALAVAGPEMIVLIAGSHTVVGEARVFLSAN